MLFKHKCDLQRPGSLLWQQLGHAAGIRAAHAARALTTRGPEQPPYNSGISHSFLPPAGRGGRVSLTSVSLSNMTPKVPVTLALANELCIYFGCKIQGFPTSSFVPYLLKEGFLSCILSLHPSMKCGICNQLQRRAFTSASVGWIHKDIFYLSTMSHFLISFTPACIQVSYRNYTM